MTPTTRYMCPLCDWHHDETAPDFSNPDATHPFIGQGWAAAIDGLAAGFVAGRAAVVEAAVKAHLETHPLIEWARALAEERRDRADAARGMEIAMDEWGKSDRHHAEKSVAMAAERGAWNTTRQRVWGAAFIADDEDVTDWQRGYRACSVRVMAALDEPVDSVIYDFNAPLRTPATPEAAPLRTPATAETAAELHARRAHPGWEYATTEGQRKRWDDADQPPYDPDGDPDPTWERNTDAGRDGWERFDYTEESYWRRPLRTPATPSRTMPDKAATSGDAADNAGEQPCGYIRVRWDIAQMRDRCMGAAGHTEHGLWEMLP